jgi:RNA polymerase sigma factor (sigma-70 family)
MVLSQLNLVLRHLRDLLRDDASQQDRLLLERFVTARDESAFEGLLARHGPMVLDVCRRVLQDPQTVEDAFQATWLVLIRKAGSIRQSEVLGNWLYGVAYRTAARARVEAAKRRDRESRACLSEAGDPLAEMTVRELFAVLDEELNGLPGKYRTPLVLCYLEQRTRDEAAQQSGCSLATLDRRLSRGRALLKARLARRGLTLALALFPTLLSQAAASIGVPASLASSTLKAATTVAAGGAATLVVSANAALLTEKVVGAMTHTRFRLITATGLLLVTLLGAGVCKSLLTEPTRAAAPATTAGDEPATTRLDDILDEALAAARKLASPPSGLLREIATARVKGGNKPAAEKEFAEVYRILDKSIAKADAHGKPFLVTNLGSARVRGGDRAAARVSFQKALELARSKPQENDRSDALQYLARSQAECGEIAAALEAARGVQPEMYRDQVLADIAVAQVRDGDIRGGSKTIAGLGPLGRVKAWIGVARLQAASDRPAAVLSLREARQAMDLLEKAHQPGFLGEIALVQAEAESEAAARKTIDEADALARRDNTGFYKPWHLTELAVARARAGDRRGAKRILEEVLSGPDFEDHPGPIPVRACIALGDFRTAYRTLHQPFMDETLQTAGLLELARAQAASGDVKGAVAWARAEEEPRARAFALLGAAEGLLERTRSRGASLPAVSAPTPEDVRTRPAPRKSHEPELTALVNAYNTSPVESGEKFADRFLRLAQAYPDEPLAVAAVEWSFRLRPHGSPQKDDLELLRNNLVRNERIGEICSDLRFHARPAAAAEALREVLEKNPSRRVRARACLALGQLLQDLTERGRRLAADRTGRTNKFYEEYLGRREVDLLRAANPGQTLREAERCYERLLADYADVKVGDEPVGDRARAALFEIRHLQVGGAAPDIKGQDLDGRAFRLSEYRGKVVVLVFCGHWCSACRAMYPTERDLVKKNAGRPFALLEVNSDEKPEKVKELMRKGDITWRAWWDGQQGPIARKWNVSAWPTVYVLDAQGVIRDRNPDKDSLDETVQKLLKELER